VSQTSTKIICGCNGCHLVKYLTLFGLQLLEEYYNAVSAFCQSKWRIQFLKLKDSKHNRRI